MKNVIFAGVGGQGVILAGKILMDAALRAGYDVKESEVHGMAQRGGSVDCHVRYGDRVYSPLIEKGTADFIVSFELLEIMRKIEYLKQGGTLIVNRLKVDPAPVQAGLEKYPEDIEAWLKSNVPGSRVIDADGVLDEIKSKKALNIVMLGVLSNHLEFTLDQWKEAIASQVKEKFLEMNLKGFEMGRELGR